MLRIVGIDPGRAGALALICGGVVHDVIDVPLMEDNSQVQVDGAKLCAWIDKNLPFDLVILENVQPRQGKDDGESMAAGRAFRFGLICGQLRMAFQCYGITPKLVTPGSWKRHFQLLKSGKEASRVKALHVARNGERWLYRKGDHNRAEACLLALYGQERRGFL